MYVKVPTLNELENSKKDVDGLYNLAVQYQNNPNWVFKERWSTKAIDERIQTLFCVPGDPFGYSIAISDYAPYQLARESGDYELFIDGMSKDDLFFQKEICRMLGKDYSPQMHFGESAEEIRSNAINHVEECFKRYAALPQTKFNVVKCEEMLIELRMILETKKQYISDGPYQKKHKVDTETKQYNNMISDTNSMAKFCGPPYYVSKAVNVRGNQEAWRYRINLNNEANLNSTQEGAEDITEDKT